MRDGLQNEPEWIPASNTPVITADHSTPERCAAKYEFVSKLIIVWFAILIAATLQYGFLTRRQVLRCFITEEYRPLVLLSQIFITV